jgi:hypothetical protein
MENKLIKKYLNLLKLKKNEKMRIKNKIKWKIN